MKSDKGIDIHRGESLSDNSCSMSASPGVPVPAWLLFLAAFVALSIGGWIYVVARPETCIYSVCNARIALPHSASFPDFVLFSLPDGLWSLSSILMLHPVLRGEPLRLRLAIISVVPLLGVGSELLQAVGWVPGVFDIWDLVCYALPLFTYIIYQSFHNFFKHENF